MSSQGLEVQPGPIDAGEGSNESKEPQQPKHPGASDRGRQRDDVDPMAAQVPSPASGGQDSTDEFDRENAGQNEFGRLDLGSFARLEVIDEIPERDVNDRQRRHRQLPRHFVRDEPAVERVARRPGVSNGGSAR
jgi:hypothetical protein